MDDSRTKISRREQVIASLLLVLICLFPLLETNLSAANMFLRQGSGAPVSHELLPQTVFITSPAPPPSEVKHERVWNSSTVTIPVTTHLTRLRRQIVQQEEMPTAAPRRFLLISLQSSSDC